MFRHLLPAGLRTRKPGLTLQMRGACSLFLALLLAAFTARAQKPTSLQYPTPVYFIANTSNVYLAPTLSGNATSYTVSPALPAGLSLNSGTGLISGIPTAVVTPAQTYTVTASDGTNSTNFPILLGVTQGTFNNNGNQISFVKARQTFPNGGNGRNAGDVVLYTNVTTIGGQVIDCIVKTVEVSNVGSWNAYDQDSASGASFNSNSDAFFSPQVNFNASPAGGGYITFSFQYILGGTYSTTTKSGTNVTLRNVKLNAYDIDGNAGSTQNNSNQYNEFDGFDTSEVGSGSTLQSPSYSDGRTLYRSGTSVNNTNVIADATRVRLTYSNVSAFTVRMGAGAGGAAFFFLDFSAGPAFSTAVIATPPTLDLNTTKTGTRNDSFGCGSALGFVPAGQPNIASGVALSGLTVKYNPTTNVRDGADELLVIGATNYPLNLTGTLPATVTVGAVTYNIASTTSSSTDTNNTISFTRTTGGTTFTVTDAQNLLRALQYSNTSSTPTSGDRHFRVAVRTEAYASPAAVFTATLNCVRLSGNVYHDIDGLSDITVNNTATGATGAVKGPLAANTVYAVITDGSNKVVGSPAILAGGSYSFGRLKPGTYTLVLSNTAVALGNTFTAPSYPALGGQLLQSTGENLGASAGNDGLVDGKLRVTLGSLFTVSNANFGIQLPPTTTSYTNPSQPNPGGFNYYTLPQTAFTGADQDGTVASLEMTAFPTGANYLKVGSTIYTNGGNCPPQSTCTAWPGAVTVPYADRNTIAVDPSVNAATSVSLSYRVIDNGGLNSGVSSTITLPFDAPATNTVSGFVWNDNNGNGTQDAGEAFSNAAGAGQTLYAMLIQTSNTYSGNPTVYAATAVVAGTGAYSFSNVPSGNAYEVRIVSRTTAPGEGVALNTIVPALAPNYAGVSTNNGSGTIAALQNTKDLAVALGNLTGSRSGVALGIEQIPTADAKTLAAPNNTFTVDNTIPINGKPSYSILSNNAGISGATQLSLSGSDPEDCVGASSCNTGKKFVINSIKPNTKLYYNTSGTIWKEIVIGTNDTNINNFDPAKLRIHGEKGQGFTSATELGFTYRLVDAAGVPSAPASYALRSSSTALPVELLSFEGSVNHCTARLTWTSGSEAGSKAYVVEKSTDGHAFEAVATIAARQGVAPNAYQTEMPVGEGASLFRLKIVEVDGNQAYSSVLRLVSNCAGTPVAALYPNPATQSIQLTGIGAEASVRILDLSGKLIWTQTGVSEADLLNIAPLNAGEYFVEVKTASQNAVYLRFVKQ